MKKTAVFLSLVLLLVTGTAGAADKSMTAVASEGTTPVSQVSAVAARCPYFLVFDGKGNFVEVLVNPYRNASGGAASRVVGFLSGKGITHVIAGAFGRNMVSAMKDAGMKYREFKGSVAEAVEMALK